MSDIYKKAASIIKRSKQGKQSRYLAYQNKAAYAVAQQCLQNLTFIETQFKKISPSNEIKDQYQAYAILTDFLFHGKISGGGALKKFILENQSQLEKADKNENNMLRNIKYIRPNFLKVDQNESEKFLQHIQQNFKEFDINYDKDVDTLIKVCPKQDCNKSIDLHLNPLIKSMKFIIQDKASCLPVLAFKNIKSGSVIDACSAPGNKTILLAEIMFQSKNQGKIYAIEKNFKRFQLLNQRIEKAVKNKIQVECVNTDFLDLDPQNYADVKYILLDPPCSNSGTR